MSDAAAFLSYAHRDDAYLDGGLTALCQKLALVVSARVGHDFAIFQDRKDIRWGQHWPSRLAEGLAGSRFLIPVLSPSFFTSDPCQQELAQFLELEQATGRRDLILPLYLLPTPLVDDRAQRAAHPLAAQLAERQYCDWRPLRHLPLASPDVRQMLDLLANDIVRAMERPRSTPAPTPGRPADSEQVLSSAPVAPRKVMNFSGSVIAASNAMRAAKAATSIGQLSVPTPPKPWTPGMVFRDLDAPWCPEMVVIPAGSFTMGAPASEQGSTLFERPEHRVRFTTPFALGRFPVTFDEFDEFCVESGRAKPSDAGWGRGRRPVINVSLGDADAYVSWLSAVSGTDYRLPSEAEWEYACRAATIGPFWTGMTISTEDANYDGNSRYGPGLRGVYRHCTTPVDQFRPNPFGLHDMHGNIWEWCMDPWHETYERAPTDGSAWLDHGDAQKNIIRGGAWLRNADYCRSSRRGRAERGGRFDAVGFRVARTLYER